MYELTVRTYYDDAVRCLREGDCRGAFKCLAAALSADSDDGRCRELLGITHWEIGSPAEAIGHLERATMLVPLSAEGQLALALSYEVSGRHELARDMFVALAGRETAPAVLLEPLARALGRAKKPLLALQTCRRASRADPTATAPLIGVAFYMSHLGAPVQQVLPVLFRAHHLAPDDFEIRMLLARRLHDCGLSEEAADLLAVVDFDDSRCRVCLTAMRDIFAAVDDCGRSDRCQAILDSLTTHGES